MQLPGPSFGNRLEWLQNAAVRLNGAKFPGRLNKARTKVMAKPAEQRRRDAE